MPSLGELVLDIRANTARFRQDLAEARGEFSKFSGTLRTGLQTLGIATSVTGLAYMTKSAIDTGVEIQKMATRLGMSTDVLQQFQYIARISGASLGDLEMGIRNYNRLLSEAANDSGAAREVWDRLGMSWRDGSGNIKNFASSIEEFARKFQLKSQIDQADISFKVFGRGAQDMRLVLQKLADEGFAKLAEQAQKAGLILDQYTLESLHKAHDAFEQATASIKIGFVEAVAAAAPILVVLAEALGKAGNAARGAADLIREFKRAAQEVEATTHQPPWWEAFRQMLGGRAGSNLNRPLNEWTPEQREEARQYYAKSSGKVQWTPGGMATKTPFTKEELDALLGGGGLEKYGPPSPPREIYGPPTPGRPQAFMQEQIRLAKEQATVEKTLAEAKYAAPGGPEGEIATIQAEMRANEESLRIKKELIEAQRKAAFGEAESADATAKGILLDKASAKAQTDKIDAESAAETKRLDLLKRLEEARLKAGTTGAESEAKAAEQYQGMQAGMDIGLKAIQDDQRAVREAFGQFDRDLRIHQEVFGKTVTDDEDELRGLEEVIKRVEVIPGAQGMNEFVAALARADELRTRIRQKQQAEEQLYRELPPEPEGGPGPAPRAMTDKMVAALAKPWSDYLTNLNNIEDTAKNLGVTYDEMGAEINATSRALADFGAQGVTTGDQIDQLKERLGKLTAMQTMVGSVFDGLRTSFSGALQGILQGTQTVEQAFRNMGRNIAAALVESVINQGLKVVQQALTNFLTEASKSGLWSAILKLVGAGVSAVTSYFTTTPSSAPAPSGGGGAGPSPGVEQHGGIFTRATHVIVGEAGPEAIIPLTHHAPLALQHYARGGIARRPTHGLVGEAGAEAVVPLASGAIPVEFVGGEPRVSGSAAASVGAIASGPLVSVIVENNASNTQVEQKKQTGPSGQQIHRIIISEVQRGLDSGEFDRTLGAFGVKRQPVPR